MIRITSNMPTLVRTLNLVPQITGKAMDEVLQKEAREMSFELYGQSKNYPDNFNRARLISIGAKARHYSMGRRPTSFTPATSGISSASWEAARRLLGNARSGIFRVFDNSGMPSVKFARWGVKGKYRGKLLLGGRHKNRFSKVSLTAGQLEADKLRAEMKATPELKRMNLRALATANEIRLRMMAAKGSTVAIQWLPSFYRTRRSAVTKNGPLISQNERTKQPLGFVDFIKDGENLVGIRWVGVVPGTAEFFQRNNILQRVEAARVADRLTYLKRKIEEGMAKGK